eukprot:15431953-Alexandrium_andersonii.AAC.1
MDEAGITGSGREDEEKGRWRAIGKGRQGVMWRGRHHEENGLDRRCTQRRGLTRARHPHTHTHAYSSTPLAPFSNLGLRCSSSSR